MEKKNIISNGALYVITNEELSHGRTHEEIAKEAIAGGADIIQFREKGKSSRDLYLIAYRMREITKKYDIPFIVNDRLDIALAVDADGLHIGKNDLPPNIAREILGEDKIIGISATSVKEAIHGENYGADYLGVYPIFDARGTKPDAGEPKGLQLIKDIKKYCTVPVVAVGGIKHTNVDKVIQAGADSVAVVTAIVSADNIKQSTMELKQKIDESLHNL